jgi:hypothetical protein
MQASISKPKKDAATFRKKKARRIEINIKKDVLKQLKVLQYKAES